MLGLDTYLETFNGCLDSLSRFPEITEEDLKIRVKISSFGHRKTFIRAIELLREINCTYIIESTPKKRFKEEELFERIEDPFIRIPERRKSISQGSTDFQTMKTKLLEDNKETWSSLEPDSKKTLEHQHQEESDGEY